MKTFTFDTGYKDFTTLTVGEMKAILSKHPDDMPVLATWETIYTPFRAGEYVSVEKPNHWRSEDNIPCLVFDVDQY